MKMQVGQINFGPTPSRLMMDEEDEINNLRAELEMMLDTLKEINSLNSHGKTKEIADTIRPILNHYQK